MASFRKHNDQVFETIQHRLAQISSKPTTNIEDKFVVTNYGVGGHYLPHSKYIDDDHLINNKERDAIVIVHVMYFVLFVKVYYQIYQNINMITRVRMLMNFASFFRTSLGHL